MSDAAGDRPDFSGVRWTTLDRAGFADEYRRVVLPRLDGEGKPPDHRPTHEWFRERGLRSFLAALRRHHDLSLGEFWTEVLGHEEAGYEWNSDHEGTVDALDRFVERRRKRHADLADASVDTLRRRLNLYVRAYAAANGDDDLLSPVARDADVPAYRATDACYAAFDRLDAEGYAARTKRRVRSVVDEWYTHLVGRKRAGVNPATGLYTEFKWEVTDADPPALAPAHVRALTAAAESTRDRLLVVALAAWGLRAGEAAALHADQFVREGGDVTAVRFDERKNGPGEVSVLYGEETLSARLDALATDDEPPGYLFPSAQAASGHVTRGTVWSWFRDLARAADLPDTVDGARPSPQLARRFWYDAYTSVLGPVLDLVGEVADEQGSADPTVVVENYLRDERARDLRREFMRDRLAAAFEGPTDRRAGADAVAGDAWSGERPD
ncbi:tyrosine-type recombinase/integrase [Candidatus Halobonum tyrrellensis]|uniref:Tyr recombinase domain-containing protein n=1 Tax=Candidatus Halobonum tyrrellensis G22 TaxID=1324957 RepID=V4H8D5_9EURY|nr:tyrosine-type recombinase/integrase [Candidatus Halobonum tyrrellensis]ESP86950.1 hypothetical protein K933_16857 [Candidatus Halobonum tyrrellensis G22]